MRLDRALPRLTIDQLFAAKERLKRWPLRWLLPGVYGAVVREIFWRQIAAQVARTLDGDEDHDF